MCAGLDGAGQGRRPDGVNPEDRSIDQAFQLIEVGRQSDPSYDFNVEAWGFGAGAWAIDQDRLRSTLDGLRKGLEGLHPGHLPTREATLGIDRRKLYESVCLVVEHARAIDLDPSSHLKNVVSEFRPKEQAVRLRDLVHQLGLAWEDRVRGFLGQRKIEILRDLLNTRVPDFLSVLGRQDDENSHSSMQRYLFDPRCSPRLAPAALNSLVERLDQPEKWRNLIRHAIDRDCLGVRREYTIGREWSETDSLDRIDLVVVGPGFILAIENKIWAPEHDNQTPAYWNWLETLKLRHGALFVSPAGSTAACSEFHAVSYLELLGCLLEGPASVEIGDDERLMLASYAKTLAHHILRAELRAFEQSKGKKYERS